MKYRVRRYIIAPEVFPSMFSTGVMSRVEQGIPPGAQLRGCNHDPYTNQIIIFVEHPTFEEVVEGGVPVEGEIRISRIF